jgi:hypothetical protein
MVGFKEWKSKQNRGFSDPGSERGKVRYQLACAAGSKPALATRFQKRLADGFSPQECTRVRFWNDKRDGARKLLKGEIDFDNVLYHSEFGASRGSSGCKLTPEIWGTITVLAIPYDVFGCYPCLASC